MKKKENKITKSMTFAELIEKDSEAANKLAEQGLFCGGCPMAQFETLEDGARAHGIDADELVKKLNLNEPSVKANKSKKAGIK